MTLRGNFKEKPPAIHREYAYFETVEDFDTKASTNRNDFGQRVEEYEIQFIDGDAIDCALASAVGINQANFSQYLDALENWDDDQKRLVINAVGESGYTFGDDTKPEDFDVDIYHVKNLRDLAVQFVDEGLFGDIPERLQPYLDHDAIARDLGFDYTETEIAGKRLIYRCG